MGTLTFSLPSNVSADVAAVLQRAYLAGGQDGMPYVTRVERDRGQLRIVRDVSDSGNLVIPWRIDGAGLLASSTATLIERAEPYCLQLELARGKVNQLRAQASDWQLGGLQVPSVLDQLIGQATRSFGQAVAAQPGESACDLAQSALTLSYQASAQLVHAYLQQVFHFRHLRQPRLDTRLGCRLNALPDSDALANEFTTTFNLVAIPFAWNEIEPAEAEFHWERQDELVDWALARKLNVIGGPLVDFSTARLPDWLWLWQGDLSSIVAYLCDYVESAVKRYSGRIRTWQLTANSNAADVLSLGEDELLWLTVRLAEVARHADPELDLTVGIAQPWGELMAVRERKRSPFEFADTLLRAGLNLAALDLELIMGVSPRGSYCRDLLEVSRLIDLYSLLGAPLHITLGYPSSTAADPQADADWQVDAGHWGEGITPATQADWAAAVAELVTCKPAVRTVQWVHWNDAAADQVPNGGLVDPTGQVKPALVRLRGLRQTHLHCVL
jgi:hypothetical protein